MSNQSKTTGSQQDPRVVRTRATVLGAGQDLMMEGGVRSITVEEIASRTGIAKTTIYRHWRSREELVLAVIAENGFTLPATRTSDPVRDIRTILVALWKALADPTRRSAMALVIDSVASNPGLASLHRDLLSARSSPLVDAIDRAIDAGAVQARLDAVFLSELLASPLIVRAFLRADGVDRRYIDRLVKVVLEIEGDGHAASRGSRGANQLSRQGAGGTGRPRRGGGSE
jgi:AcrR family transcriptional regulator